jgi:hypothetical protein
MKKFFISLKRAVSLFEKVRNFCLTQCKKFLIGIYHVFRKYVLYVLNSIKACIFQIKKIRAFTRNTKANIISYFKESPLALYITYTLLHTIADVIIGILIYIGIVMFLILLGMKKSPAILIGAVIEFLVAYGLKKFISKDKNTFIIAIISLLTVIIGVVVGIKYNIPTGALIEGLCIIVIHLISDYDKIPELRKYLKYKKKKEERKKRQKGKKG